MKLANVKFMQAVRVGGKMVEAVPEAEACAFGVVVPAEPLVLVPWHMVRYSEQVKTVKRGKAADG